MREDLEREMERRGRVLGELRKISRRESQNIERDGEEKCNSDCGKLRDVSYLRTLRGISFKGIK